jgi:hypothetical protein
VSRQTGIATSAGFTLLPVVLAMSLVAAIAFLLNRDNGVNANLIGAQSDRERARYAAEAGLQAVNYKIQNLPNACAGGYPISSPPVIDNNFNGATADPKASYSAYAETTTDSPPKLTLNSTGSYNGASVKLTKTNAYVYHSAVIPWVVQPGPGTGKDTYLRQDTSINKTKNYGGSTDLILDNGSQILLQFDLSPLPAGSRVSPRYDLIFGLQRGAIISMFQPNFNSRNAFAVMLITQSWVAGTKNGNDPADGATWNKYDGVNNWPLAGGYDPRVLLPVPENRGFWLNMDVTDAVLAWMSGAYPNYGVWLKDPLGIASKYAFFASDYRLIPDLRPKLTVDYLLPCGATAPPSA